MREKLNKLKVRNKMKPINAQLTGAIQATKTSDRFEQLQYTIPQRLEDGKLYNYKNVCIGTHDAPDEVFGDADIEAPNRFTTAFVKRITDPVQKLIDASEAPEETEEEEEVSEEPKAEKKADDGFNDVRKAIKKGKGKKALKLIKAHKENGSRGSVLTRS